MNERIWVETFRLFVLGLAVLVAAGCAPSYDFRNIPPRYEVRNSPVPVPWPREKPAIVNRKVAETAPGSPVEQPSPRRGQQAVEVSRGDTVYAIATRHGLPVRDVIRANELRAPYTLRVGQRLTLPDPRYHVVRKGETGYSIARGHGVELASLMRINGIKPPYTLSVGQRLQLPGGSAEPPSLGTIPVRVASNDPAPTRLPAPPPRRSNRFGWPLEGRLLSSFGPKEGGLHNDGINIEARTGAPVRAAESGVVAYSGNGLKGYGNLLLIRHDGGWVTAYAHNQTLLVSRGQRVERGDIIARAGQSGGVAKPQLHFEIRKGAAAVDPLGQLDRRRRG